MKFFPSFNLLDDVFDNVFQNPFHDTEQLAMKTDVSEKDGNYLLDMELPGYNKDDIQISLEDGYLEVSANRKTNKEEKDDKGNIIRQERYSGSCKRSFYVGDGVSEEDIKAKFENGELKLEIPKKDNKQIENKKYISIQ